MFRACVDHFRYSEWVRRKIMPAEVTVKYLGEAGKEQAFRDGLKKIFEKRLGTWKVSLLGDQSNTTWEAKVMAPGDHIEHVRKFDGEDGHNVEKILGEISRIADGLREKE
jgi:hypothetical protein